MNPNEYISYENRYYVNPTLTRDETLSFVDSLRNTVRQDNTNIAKSTEALGTNVTSNLGGLTGSQGYFAQRYQTTPMQTQMATLKATAQADALNKLMTNYKNQAANRYKQAYRAAQKSGGGGGNGGGTSDDPNGNTSNWNGDVDYMAKDSPVESVYVYKTPYKDPVKVYIDNNAPRSESDSVLAQLGRGSVGQAQNINGTYYVWSDYGQYGPTWYRARTGF